MGLAHGQIPWWSAPSKETSLHAVAKKVGTTNKVAITCGCNNSCNPRSRCRCRRNQVKYCHSSRRDCGNAATILEGTDPVILSRSEEKHWPFTSFSPPSNPPHSQPPKPTKRRRTDTTSARKNGENLTLKQLLKSKHQYYLMMENRLHCLSLR